MAVCAALASAGCGLGPGSQRRPPRDCTLSEDLVPSCGALLGITTPRPERSELARVEQQVGRRFDFVYRFHDVNDPVPTPEERDLVAEGRILHLTIDARDYASADRESVTWADVAAGRYDASLAAQGAGVASLGSPVFVTFDHEPDQPAENLGGPADFVAAWRHVHELFARAGATNAVWVWVVMGWAPALDRAEQLWPGRPYVDWVSWEVFNPSGCRTGEVDPARFRSFEDIVRTSYEWARSESTAVAGDLPMMISESGTSQLPGDTARTAQWFADIPDTLRRYPQVKAVGLWDHGGTGATCDFRFGSDPTVLAGVAAMAGDPWFSVAVPAPDGR